jgi:hypothetical protein
MLGMQSPAVDPALAVQVKYHHLLLPTSQLIPANEQASDYACLNDSAQSGTKVWNSRGEFQQLCSVLSMRTAAVTQCLLYDEGIWFRVLLLAGLV